jgi:glucose/arabinose dehydrogenase
VGVAIDDEGRVYVVESGYAYGEVFTEPRLLRLEAGGVPPTVIAKGGRGGPWTGVTWHGGHFFVADGNVLEGGRLLRVSLEGKTDVLVSDLPSFGDHHTNGPVVGPDGWIYFGQGTATNAAIVGRDNLEFGWLKRKPEFHDIPGQDVTLTGENVETEDVVSSTAGRKITGPFLPFGTPSQRGQVIKGAIMASGSILRVRAEGGEPEQVAWGFRNPFGLAFAPDGALFVTDNGYDERGSRHVWGSPDFLWRVARGQWHGWPDYVGGIPITDPQFHGPGNKPLRFLLAQHPNPVPQPVARFAVHSSADGLDFSSSDRFGYAGEAFVAIFGDQAPATGKILGPVGGKVVRVDIQTGVITDFAVNRADREGPASKVGGSGFERPVAVRFDRVGNALYVVDFGVLLMDGKQSRPQQNTGAVWRIRRPL